MKHSPTPNNPPHALGPDVFAQMATWTTRATGSPWGFVLAVTTILLWAIVGPFFHFSEMWQLVVNTGTTIITFLMVFLIQNTQNRESRAMHLKLDEIIRSIKEAKNELLDAENLSEGELEKLAARYRELAKESHVREPSPS